MDKLYIALLNQRTATVIGGHYGLIKAQHNVASNHVHYAPLKFPKIMHEYVVLWQKP